MSEYEAEWPEPTEEMNTAEESIMAALLQPDPVPVIPVAQGSNNGERSIWETITLADALLVFLTLISAVRNLADLDFAPFSVAEAVNGLASWSLWQPAGSVAATLPHSPAYLSITSPLTQIIGTTDFTMRFVPALFGTAVVFLPWLLRRRLGTVGVLVSSALLMVSPTVTSLARTADGTVIALFAGFLLFISWLRFQDGDGRHWLSSAAVALGLGLASAPLFYGLLVTGLIGWLLQRRFGIGWEIDQRDVDSTIWRQALIILAVVFVAASTMFLWAPSTMAASVSILGNWLSQFFSGTTLQDWFSPILAMGRYEIALFVLGLAGISWATWSGHPFGSLLTYWFSAALVLILLQGDVVTNVLLLVIPGYLLIGLLTQIVTSQHVSLQVWPFVLVGTVLLFAAFINLSRYLRHILTFPDENGYLFITIFCLIFFLLVGALMPVLEIETIAIGQYAILTLLSLLLFYNWGTAWWLGHTAANNPLERWVTLATDDDILSIQTTLQEISQQAHGSDDDLVLFVAHESPVLQWYLREFENLETGDGIPANGFQDAIITPIDAELNLSADYIGSDFVLSQQQVLLDSDEPAAHWQDILRWWIFHRSRDFPEEEQLILWVRADIGQ